MIPVPKFTRCHAGERKDNPRPPQKKPKHSKTAQNSKKKTSKTTAKKQTLFANLPLFLGWFWDQTSSRFTLQETDKSPQKWHFEDDFPFPQVGYVNSLEGRLKSCCFFLLLEPNFQVYEEMTEYHNFDAWGENGM